MSARWDLVSAKRLADSRDLEAEIVCTFFRPTREVIYGAQRLLVDSATGND
jgi:hypothetical protein